MKILLLTQYFPPETGAPQNRLYDLALKLKELGASVSVLTAFPNYPQYRISAPYRGKFYQREHMDGLDIHRSWIYVSAKKSVLHRLLSYFSFTGSSLLTGWFRTVSSMFDEASQGCSSERKWEGKGIFFGNFSNNYTLVRISAPFSVITTVSSK